MTVSPDAGHGVTRFGADETPLAPEAVFDLACELCEEARITPWWYEDDECWVAECESCWVPMIVWRRHDPSPPDDVRAALHARLVEVAAERFEFDGGIVVDDVLRTIPSHYHAHARARQGFGRHGVRPKAGGSGLVGGR